MCSKYQCCSDAECGEGESCSNNKCIPQEEKKPDVADKDKEDAWKAIESAREAIGRNKDAMDMTEADDILKEALAAYERGDYSTAKERANEALMIAEGALPGDTEPALPGYLNPAYGAILLLIIAIVAIFLKRRSIMLLLTGKGARLHKIEEIEQYIETIRPIIRKMNDEASLYEKKLSAFSLIGAKKDAAEKMLDEGDAKAELEIQRIVDMLSDLGENGHQGNAGDGRKFNLHRIEEIEQYIG
ncbi:MAG: hypothetical protein IH593_00050, partial [Bacteroidales bacterium]|nr:hypothetical protein [Bacteroidales bacterium]